MAEQVAVTYKGTTIGEDGKLPRTRSRSYSAGGVTFRKGVPTLADKRLADELEQADGFDFEVSTDTAGATDPAATGDDQRPLAERTVAELRELAAAAEVKGRGSMGKDALVEALTGTESDPTASAPEAAPDNAGDAATAAQAGDPAQT